MDELDKTGEFNWEIHNKMAKWVLWASKFLRSYGGHGSDYVSYVIMMEEFARVSAVLSIYANTSNSLGGGR